MTNFPIIDTPINKTTALVLGTYKAATDYDEALDRLHQAEATLKALKSQPHPWNKRHKTNIKIVGQEIQSILQDIVRIKKMIGRRKGEPLDLQCFITVCREHMSDFEFRHYMFLVREKMKALKESK